MKSLLLAATAALSLAAALPAAADVIYTNGVLTTGAAIDIDTQIVTNAFTANPGSVANQINLVTWVHYDAGTPVTVDWSFSNGDPLAGGAVFAHGTASTAGGTMVSTQIGHDGFGLENFFDTTLSIGSVALTGTDLWLTLTNGLSSDNKRISWDLNEGPSAAFAHLPGDPPETATESEWFSILGTKGAIETDDSGTGGGTGGVPEPATWAMILAGFGGIGAMLRRRGAVALAA